MSSTVDPTEVSDVTIPDMRDWPATLRQLDDSIRAGKGARVRAELGRLARRRVPREHSARIAQLAWRANVPGLGIRVLGPVVRPNRRIPSQPTSEEVAEYAQCLILIGAVAEALELLSGLQGSRLPQALLYEASGHMSQWDYAKAHPLLVKYAKSGGLTAYQRLVGKVNVAACLVTLRRHKEANGLLRELLYELSLRRHYLLYGNALQISAQNFALQGRYKDVELCLDRAETTLAEAGTPDPLYVRKWRAIASLIRGKGDAASVAALLAVRGEAEKDCDWEAVRHCDEFLATYRRDTELLFRLYYGTPFESFRRRLIDDYGQISVPDEYRWCPDGAPATADTPVLDLGTGEWRGKETPFRPGNLLHRLLVLLCSDFYRPFRAAALHQGLYPGERYNPDTSPARIYEAMKRLRLTLERSGVPLMPEWDSGAYRLETTGPCAIRLRERQPLARWSAALDRLKERWGTEPFTVNEASELLRMNPRTVLRWCESAREDGALARSGKGRTVRYAFLST